jgi:hypothetical protein
VTFSLDDLFAAGLVFDISGAVLLAFALLQSPVDQFRRSQSRMDYSTPAILGSARDWADAVWGTVALALGFALQALAYLLSVAGVHAATGLRDLLGAFFLMGVSTALIWIPRRWIRPRLVKGRAREIMLAGRGLDVMALFQIGQELEDGRPTEGESPVDYVERTFGVRGQLDQKSILLGLSSNRPVGR